MQHHIVFAFLETVQHILFYEPCQCHMMHNDVTDLSLNLAHIRILSCATLLTCGRRATNGVWIGGYSEDFQRYLFNWPIKFSFFMTIGQPQLIISLKIKRNFRVRRSGNKSFPKEGTVKPRLTATQLMRSPCYYGHVILTRRKAQSVTV